eukprot:6468512-Alexandrium_andersonii.AAC.1
MRMPHAESAAPDWRLGAKFVQIEKSSWGTPTGRTGPRPEPRGCPAQNRRGAIRPLGGTDW